MEWTMTGFFLYYRKHRTAFDGLGIFIWDDDGFSIEKAIDDEEWWAQMKEWE